MSKEKEKEKKPSGPKKPSKIAAFFSDDKTRFIFALLLLLIGVWLFMAFVSFLCEAGKADSAAVLQGQKPASGMNNWTGALGATIAELCINQWIGVSSILYVVFILRLGYSMVLQHPLRRYFMVLVNTAIWSIWFSLFFGAVFVHFYKDSYLYLGGHHGYDLEQLLESNIGYPGVVLTLVVSLIILLVFVSTTTIDKTQSAFGLFGRWKESRAQKRAEEEAARLALAAEEADKKPEDELDPATDFEPLPIIETISEEEEELPADEPKVEPVADEPAEEPAAVVEEPAEEPAEEPTEVEPVSVEEKPVADDLPIIETISEGEYTDDEIEDEPADPDFVVTTNTTDVVEEEVQMPLEDYDPTKDLEFYQFPTFNLLKEYNAATPIDMEEQTANKERIKQTLSDYGIEIQSISATVGPTITLFEIVLVNGTKISRIKSLSDEIAMSIASKTGIRIIAPIPGKCAIGIEVPNKDPQTVSMRECIQSRAFQESRAALPVALGKTITNEVFTFDLAKAPHMLVAGATGQGKSVGLNAIITSLLYKKHPSQLKIVLVDPKMVEFAIYSRIDKHFLAKLPDAEDPIITDVSKVVETLKSLCAEMEDRYALLKEAGCRKLEEYNDKFIHRKLNPKKHIDAPLGSKQGTNHHYLPYIVAIVDEYGDLIMTAGKEVELPIARIAQKARAVGIHMIIATQRPSAKIVTGIIKANFPARIAFRVASATDSGIILDQSGAQNLIGRGDLFISLGDRFERVQCAFVDTPEVDHVNEFIAGQQSYPTCYILPEPKPEQGEGVDDGEGGSSRVDLNQLDPMFDECAELVVSTGQGSTSMIQRKFGIGYNRAGRIMDQLEAAGIVGPYQGSKARAVLVDSTGELVHILEDIKNR